MGIMETFLVALVVFASYVSSAEGSVAVTAHVGDDNDHGPSFTQSIYRTTMSENYARGTSVTSVSATDIGSNARMVYSLAQRDQEYFFIMNDHVTNTGILKVFKMVDYDSLANPFFNLMVFATDMNTLQGDVAYIEVYITDYNDNPPVFIPRGRRIAVYENEDVGLALTRFSAVDRDTGDNQMFEYDIDRDTDPMHQFSIDTNGLVRIVRPLDRETTPARRVHILARDNGTPQQTGTATLVISLIDINDNHPVFAENYMPVIPENQPGGTTVVTVSGIDNDATYNGPPFDFWLPCHGQCPCSENPTCYDFAFSFIPGGGMNGMGSGIVTTRRSFSREEQGYYYLPIIMRDSGRPPMSGTNTLTIVIGERDNTEHNPEHN